jgi:hypothetical protein
MPRTFVAPVESAAHEHDPSREESELMRAMQAYKEASGRMFPTWSEVLEVVLGLGYEKAARPGEEARSAAPAGELRIAASPAGAPSRHLAPEALGRLRRHGRVAPRGVTEVR